MCYCSLWATGTAEYGVLFRCAICRVKRNLSTSGNPNNLWIVLRNIWARIVSIKKYL